MGADAGIFARNAKKYFWFDREKNMRGWMYTGDEEFFDNNSQECDRAEDLYYEKLCTYDTEDKGCTAEEVKFMAELSKKGWLSDPDADERSRSLWMDCVLKFVGMFPNDLFTVKSDHGSEWPECVDKYEEVHFDKSEADNTGFGSITKEDN
jgi:hypothetical protein